MIFELIRTAAIKRTKSIVTRFWMDEKKRGEKWNWKRKMLWKKSIKCRFNIYGDTGQKLLY